MNGEAGTGIGCLKLASAKRAAHRGGKVRRLHGRHLANAGMLPPGAEARTCETDFFRDKERLSLGLRRILSPSSPPTRGGQTADTFKPYGVGLVQLEDEVRVEARLTEADPSRLRFGMELRLVFVPFYTDDDGNEIVTWAFEPV